MTITYKIEHHTNEFQTFTASATITKGQLLSMDSNGKVTPCTTSTTNCVGVADEAASSGDTIRVLSGYIIVTLQSAGAITAGASLETAAAGKVDDTSGTGMTLQAWAMEAASGASEWIKCLCHFPCTV